MVSSKKESWHGNINYYLIGLLDAVDAPYIKYNTLLYGNEYGSKHILEDAQISIVKGMEKIRHMNDVNRK